jgi:hypothetical protein
LKSTFCGIVAEKQYQNNLILNDKNSKKTQKYKFKEIYLAERFQRCVIGKDKITAHHKSFFKNPQTFVFENGV